MSRHKRTKSRRAERKSQVTRSKPRPMSRAWWLLPLAVAAGGAIISIVVPRDTGPLNALEAVPSESDIPFPDTTRMQAPVAQLFREAREAVVRQPGSAQAWGRLGGVFDAHKLYEYAEPCYRKALALQPGEVLVMYQLALVLDFQGHGADEALALLRRVAERQPDYPPVFYRIGEVLDRNGRRAEAQDAYEMALRLDPNLAIAHQNLGQALLALGHMRASVQHLERAIELGGENNRCYASLAQGYSRLGDKRRAAEAAALCRRVQKVLELPDPLRYHVVSLERSAIACLDRAKQAMSAADYAAAIPDLKVVEESFPDNPNLQIRLATCYMKNEQPALAEEHFRKAVKLRDMMARRHGAPGSPPEDLVRLDAKISNYRRASRELP